MTNISKIARMFDVDRDTVKHWITEFSDHLSVGASSPHGNPREFTEMDIRVLALVYYYWEENPDYENVHLLLNSGGHESEVFIEHARLHTLIFQEIPNEIDETWQHGAIVGGMAFRDRRQVARSYKLAADRMLGHAMNSDVSHELDFPILFLYRHTIELYLKAALDNPPEHHDLKKLSQLLETESGGQLPEWVNDRVANFHEIDRMSSIFRYADPGPPGELWIDFHQLKTVMDKFVEVFEKYLVKQWGEV